MNGGKEYIDNHQYTDRVIASAWSDERYTNPQSLLDAAKKKLDELSFPVRSYECDVRNTGETMYLYQVVTLIDRVRKKRVEHRVVTYKEYPGKANSGRGDSKVQFRRRSNCLCGRFEQRCRKR